MRRRFHGLHLRLYPAQVQGAGSVEQVVAGIRYFSASGWADVLIVCRGGGSLEDLWTFNEEPVARAIAECAAPVISAIGHETDFTIADFVADLRAPTPSAAAELVVGTKAEVTAQLETNRQRLGARVPPPDREGGGPYSSTRDRPREFRTGEAYRAGRAARG